MKTLKARFGGMVLVSVLATGIISCGGSEKSANRATALACADGTVGQVCCGATALIGSNQCCSDMTQGGTCCGSTLLASGNECCPDDTQRPSCSVACPDGRTGASCCGATALAAGNVCCADETPGVACCGGTAMVSGNQCCSDGTQRALCWPECPSDGPASNCCGSNALSQGNLCCHDNTQGNACCGDTVLVSGNRCCSDGTQRPDCSLALAAHWGYFELNCDAAQSIVCSGIFAATTALSGGHLRAVYTTGPRHYIPGQVTVFVDGVAVGTSLAALPSGTVNPDVNLGSISSGSHRIALQFASTDGRIAGSWGGLLDLYIE